MATSETSSASGKLSAPKPSQPGAPQNPFFIVGVGASAGGMEAFKQFLGKTPADTGAAYVLLQHLDPKRESILPALLAGSATIPIAEARDGVRIEPDHAYVIPPSMDLEIKDGHLHLLPRPPDRMAHLPIDLFFNTLAKIQKEKAIGVVLSGTASDGSLGLQAIKAAGGICFAQDPRTAKFDGMPQSAIATGCVDAALSPEEIAEEIARLAAGLPLRLTRQSESLPDGEDEWLAETFVLLKKSMGNDFAAYKPATLLRRLRRRMGLLEIREIPDYVSHLESHPEEVQALHQDLLIGVTSFFRDPPAIEALRLNIFPKLLKDRPAEEPLRLWVPGCSTGEEVYTLAICLLELLDGADPSIQIFGTDISESAVARARTGIYPAGTADHVSADRLERFFIPVDGKLQIRKSVRSLCVFARHDLVQDPPFSRLDLISCRNVLIYLKSAAQRRVMAGFHYALKPSGFLVLGASEGLSASLDLFQAVDREIKIFAPRGGVPHSILMFGLGASPREEIRLGVEQAVIPLKAVRSDVQREADRVLLNRYGPAGVLIDENLEVLQFRGDTHPYFEHPEGSASLSLPRIVRKGLLAGLSLAVKEAKESGRPVRRPGLRFQHAGHLQSVDVEVVVVLWPATQQRFFLILFENTTTKGGSRRQAASFGSGLRGQDAKDQHIVQIEEELTATRQYLQSVIEEQGAANQDLLASHEEALSRNEELQSLNEEVETAKEELQSGNEELTTLNEELNQRNLELLHLTDDLVNLLGSLYIPVVLLSPDLRLRRFTPGAAKLFNLLPTDQDRLLSDLRSSFDLPDLGKLVLQSMETAAPIEREVQDASGCWHSLRIRPYRTSDNKIDGAVMILVDIDALKRSAEVVAKARDFADAIVQAVREPLLVLSEDLLIQEANRAFYDFFRVSPAETLGRHLEDLCGGAWNLPELRKLLELVLERNADLDDFVVEQEFPSIGCKTMVLNARRVRQAERGTVKVLLAMEDRTEIKKVEAVRAALLTREQAVAREAERAARLKDEFVATVSHELRGPLSAMAGWLYVLEQTPGDAEIVARGLAGIGRNLQAQTRLVDDLLDTAQIMTGKLRLSVRLMDLTPVVEASLLAVSAAAEAKGITVQLSSDGSKTDVFGDPDRMQQIVWNLLSNAVKFTPAGGRVDVRLSRAGNCVQLQVRDTGRGISPDFQPHVFDRFRQAEASPTREHLGLGLGLAIVRELIELHGGTVTVESPGKDQGSLFTVALPVPALLTEAPRVVEERPALEDRPVLAGLRLLVVEDDDSSREMLVTLLQQHGAEVDEAASAAEAYVALERAVPNVLISDIGMPGESGYDLMRKIRMFPLERGGRVPAIAFTAYSNETDRLAALAAGFQMHHTKPTDPTRLIAAIAELGRQ